MGEDEIEGTVWDPNEEIDVGDWSLDTSGNTVPLTTLPSNCSGVAMQSPMTPPTMVIAGTDPAFDRMITINDDDGNVLVEIMKTGKIKFHDIYEPDTTARIFWNAITMRGKQFYTLMKQNEDLEREVQNLKQQLQEKMR